MKQHDVVHIESQIKELRGSLARLADDRTLQELLFIIRQPGWTTPAEYTLVSGVVDSMLAHTEVLAGLTRVLVNGSRLVGTEVELNPQPLPPKEVTATGAAVE